MFLRSFAAFQNVSVSCLGSAFPRFHGNREFRGVMGFQEVHVVVDVLRSCDKTIRRGLKTCRHSDPLISGLIDRCLFVMSWLVIISVGLGSKILKMSKCHHV